MIDVKTLAVVGAGQMGAGIAQVAAQTGIEVVLIDVNPEFVQKGLAGIRAQLMDVKKGQLEMDFVIEPGENSLHVLNAVSPAFTSAFAFAPYLAGKL